VQPRPRGGVESNVEMAEVIAARVNALPGHDFGPISNDRSWPILLQKSFWAGERKFLEAADAFYAQRCEGPYRFIQNRSRILVATLKSDAAAEKSKDQLSRDFWGCPIFDFCNNIGTFETCPLVLKMSVHRGRPEVAVVRLNRRE
jgi:hypothetical protein